jgi:hypothetical protein
VTQTVQVDMTSPLVTYLQDHLAGARFAVSVLQELADQDVNLETADLAACLLQEIEEDRTSLENYVVTLGGDTSAAKEAIAWMAQKTSRWKLSPNRLDGIFEAVELLSLGVLGKLALWNTLRTIDAPAVSGLDLDSLCRRATDQYSRLESLRLRLAPMALQTES